jgi:hypothetical protein
MTQNGAGTAAEAPHRAERIAAFRAELAELAREGVLVLADEERARVDAHQDAVLKILVERPAAATAAVAEAGGGKLSLGLRVGALLGAAALAVSAILILQRFWGRLSTPELVAALVGAPALGCLGTDFVAHRFKIGYLTSLCGLVTLTWFLFGLTGLGDLFAITPSAHAFLAWGAFALILAYAHELRLFLVLGIGLTGCWLAAMAVNVLGSPWTSALERPESLLPAGLLLLALPILLSQLEAHRRFHRFLPLYRIAGLLGVLAPVLALSAGAESLLVVLSRQTVETAYGLAGLLLSVAAVAAGHRWRCKEMVNLGSMFVGLFLWLVLYDWLWHVIPNYVFLLGFAAIAAATFWALHRLRSLAGGLSA